MIYGSTTVPMYRVWLVRVSTTQNKNGRFTIMWKGGGGGGQFPHMPPIHSSDCKGRQNLGAAFIDLHRSAFLHASQLATDWSKQRNERAHARKGQSQAQFFKHIHRICLLVDFEARQFEIAVVAAELSAPALPGLDCQSVDHRWQT